MSWLIKCDRCGKVESVRLAGLVPAYWATVQVSTASAEQKHTCSDCTHSLELLMEAQK